jgi:hypothetical protein
VYLRLLELKNQFAHFDDHFSINSDNGLTLSFLHPVMLEKDMHMMGLPPTTQNGDQAEKTWTHIFEKLYPTGSSETTNYDLLVSSKFSTGKLAEIRIGEQYFAFIPKDFFILMLKSIGGAEVDRKNRTAKAEVTDIDLNKDYVLPNRQDTIDLLGSPFSREDTESIHSLEYRYQLKPANPQKTQENKKVYGIKFEYSEEGKLSKMAGSIPFLGGINMDFTPEEKALLDSKPDQ